MDLLEQTKPTLEAMVNKIIPTDFAQKPTSEKLAYLQRLSLHEKRLLLSYVRFFDPEIGNEIHAIQPENPEYLRLVAISFTKRAEVVKNTGNLSKDGFTKRLAALKMASESYPPDLRQVVESISSKGVTEMDMLRLRQAGADLMPLFFASGNGGPTDAAMVAPGRRYVVDLSGMNSVQRFVGFGDIFPDTVQEITVNGRL